MEIETVIAPAQWATALINGDTSGMDDSEIEAMNAWLEMLDGWEVVTIDGNDDPQEPRFTWHYRMYGGTADGGYVLNYVVVKR